MNQDKRLLEFADQRYVWHPFTQMKEYENEIPLIVDEGEGVYLTDIYGRRYIDGVSSLWVNVHGHRRKEIDRAIADQLKKIAHSTLLGTSNVPAVRLAKELVDIAPEGLEKVFYSDSGSEGVEIALKIAYQYWQQKGEAYREKKAFVSLENAYHGDTLGAVSVGKIPLFHEVYGPLLFETITAPSPYCYRCPYGKEKESCSRECLAQVKKILEERAGKIAGFIIEPLMQGAAGMLQAPDGFLRNVRELCTKHDVLLIADEVATGFGRTGRMFACEHEEVSPDIMVVAKGLTGGYLPLAATMTTKEVYSAFLGEYAEQKTFFHGHTYTGNQLCCAAALASLEIFRSEKTVERMQPRIEQLRKGLERFAKLPHVGDVRRCGFMTGIELVKDKAAKEPYAWEELIGHRVIMEARARGVLLRPLGSVVVLMPPLVINQKELKELIDVTYDSIKKVTGA
ncbi:MAG TPA: adenosylmethionine--8-amino-7-oxononanoate transaminase [bacterium]|nr:adenosylmethionine--8-amino-7-oxononanoate transaminase [bacterium]